MFPDCCFILCHISQTNWELYYYSMAKFVFTNLSLQYLVVLGGCPSMHYENRRSRSVQQAGIKQILIKAAWDILIKQSLVFGIKKKIRAIIHVIFININISLKKKY